MNTKPGEGMEMSASPIDRILAGEEELIPASGFVASVMERIEEEARVPAPIAFPWRRAVPGMVLAVGVFGWGGYEIAGQARAAARAMVFTVPHLTADWPANLTANFSGPFGAAGWVVIALGISLASWMVSRRISGQTGLL
jgi:hypothetical protein